MGARFQDYLFLDTAARVSSPKYVPAETLYLGTKTSNRAWTIYDKAKQLAETSGVKLSSDLLRIEPVLKLAIPAKSQGLSGGRVMVSPSGQLRQCRFNEYMLVGNRGVLHDENGVIVSPFAATAWIACNPARSPGSPKRPLAEPGRYTLLFFLDEATALAAGHRPCWSCRRPAFQRFLCSWAKANPGGLNFGSRIADIDATIHRDRITATGRKRTFTRTLSGLPEGCMVRHEGADYLIWNGALHRWSRAGYLGAVRGTRGLRLSVLTPRSIVEVLEAGYVPRVHSTVRFP